MRIICTYLCTVDILVHMHVYIQTYVCSYSRCFSIKVRMHVFIVTKRGRETGQEMESYYTKKNQTKLYAYLTI